LCTRRFPCVDNAIVAICNPVSINQETANASGAHLGEGDFLLAGELGHAPLKPARLYPGNQPFGLPPRRYARISGQINGSFSPGEA
jgi:hypothetical protein